MSGDEGNSLGDRHPDPQAEEINSAQRKQTKIDVAFDQMSKYRIQKISNRAHKPLKCFRYSQLTPLMTFPTYHWKEKPLENKSDFINHGVLHQPASTLAGLLR